MDYQQIIAGTVGKDNTFGTCVGQVKAAPMSFARFSTDDKNGVIRGYVGEGRFTEDPLETFGGAGVVEIPHMQKLLRYICENGFEHHVAANLASVAGIVHEVATQLYEVGHVLARALRLGANCGGSNSLIHRFSEEVARLTVGTGAACESRRSAIHPEIPQRGIEGLRPSLPRRSPRNTLLCGLFCHP